LLLALSPSLPAGCSFVNCGQVAVRAGGKPLTPAAVQELLGDALGDPSPRLVLWSAERRGFVDVDGATVRVPDEGSERGVTWLTRNDQTVAALIHDPMLDADSTVLEGLAATSLMLLDNARLARSRTASIRPELHDLGLAYALRSLAFRSPVPVHVVDEGVGRAPAAVEAAIYFCVLEAI
jgi:hypothetical protein